MLGAAWLGIIAVIIVLVFALTLLYYYNQIRVLSNRIDNAWSQIDVQLKRRADLVPNLVETVKGYMQHEREAIELVTQSREKILAAGTQQDRLQAEQQLTGALRSLFALAENYPQLRASENFKLLQEQLEGVENKIAYARQYYNDSVLNYNNVITTIPGSWFAGGRTPHEYIKISDQEREPVKVQF